MCNRTWFLPAFWSIRVSSHRQQPEFGTLLSQADFQWTRNLASRRSPPSTLNGIPTAWKSYPEKEAGTLPGGKLPSIKARVFFGEVEVHAHKCQHNYPGSGFVPVQREGLYLESYPKIVERKTDKGDAKVPDE